MFAIDQTERTKCKLIILVLLTAGLERPVGIVLFYPPLLQIRKPQSAVTWQIYSGVRAVQDLDTFPFEPSRLLCKILFHFSLRIDSIGQTNFNKSRRGMACHKNT